MKIRVLFLIVLISGIFINSEINTPAQKVDNISPNNPKVAICYNGQDRLVSQSSLNVFLSKGATLGSCPTNQIQLKKIRPK